MFFTHMICIVMWVSVTHATDNEDDSGPTEEELKMSFKHVTRLRDDDTKQFSTEPFNGVIEQKQTKHIGLLSSKPSVYTGRFDDTYFWKQWYALDQRRAPGPVMDHNLMAAYMDGYNGRGVTVGIIGDGVTEAYDLLWKVQRYDVNNNFETMLTKFIFGKRPVEYKKPYESSEGTRMAAVIAMTANNSMCGVGVAPEAQIVGIRVIRSEYRYRDLDILAKAISFKLTLGIDVYAFAYYSRMDQIIKTTSRRIQKAFRAGFAKGRGGLGALYVVGSGEYKDIYGDNCAVEHLVNDPHTMAIGSASQWGRVTPYSQRCAAVMATAYSSGDEGDEKVVAANYDLNCIDYFAGNSPSVAIAAGIFALVYQVRKSLTPRDMQHLVAMTSEVAPLADNPGTWARNKAGFYFSSDFGFGLLNAGNLVQKAKGWTSVPPMTTCKLTFTFDITDLEIDNIIKGTAELKECKQNWDCDATKVKYIEQVSLIATVNLQYTGSLMINLTSPLDTTVVMMEQRIDDLTDSGLRDWRIKTTHLWGEDPSGLWTVAIAVANFTQLAIREARRNRERFNENDKTQITSKNNVASMKLIVQGTEQKPKHYPPEQEAPGEFRTYSAFYSDDLHGRKNTQSGKH